jgi:hypothetical protein
MTGPVGVPRCSCELGCNSPCNPILECDLHGIKQTVGESALPIDVPVQPSTKINMQRQSRRIE